MAGEIDLLGVVGKKTEPVANQPVDIVTPPINLEPAPLIRVTPSASDNQKSPATLSALPGTQDAQDAQRFGSLTFTTSHPETQRVFDNFAITQDMDPSDEDKFKAISQAANVPVSVARNIHPSQIDRWLERQDTQLYLEQARETRKRMAVDAEAALVLRGDIKPLADSEQALAKLGLQIVPSHIASGRVQQIEETQEERSVAAGIGLSIFQSFKTFFQIIPLQREREIRLQQAADAGRTFPEVFGDWYERINPRQFTGPVIPSPGEVFGLSKRLIRFMNGAPEDKEKHEAEVLEISKELVALYETGQGISSEYAQNFWDRYTDIDPEMGKIDKALTLINIIKRMPGETAIAMTEVVGQQFVPLFGGALATIVTRQPSLGMGFMLAGGYAQERFADYNTDLMKEYGPAADLRTEAGMRAFIDSTERQDFVIGIGENRALAISLAGIFGFKIAQVAFSKNALINLAAQIPAQMTQESMSELTAQVAAGQDVDILEIMIEGMAAGPMAIPEVIIATGRITTDIKKARDGKAWLTTGEEVSSHIRGVQPHALTTASEVMADRLRDEGVTTVYVSAEQLQKFDQDLPDGETAAETLGLDKETVEQAAEDGRDIEIGADAYVRHILGKEGFDALIKHTRFSLEGMTPNEADEFLGTGERSVEEQLTSAVQDQLEKSLGITEEESVVLRDDAEAILDDVRQQFENMEGISSREADLNSLLTARRYVARAARATRATGQEVRALDLYLQDNLRITDQQVAIEQAAFQQTIKDNQAELEQAAIRRENREITEEQYLETIARLKPVTPYKQEDLPVPATKEDMTSALREGQRERVGQGQQFVGQDVGLRLDIPAYENHDTWVPTIHTPDGKPVAHEAAAHIVGDIVFTQPGDRAEVKAGRVGRGEVAKAPFAQINGTLKSVRPAAVRKRMNEIFNDPDWVQVGYDPRRHTFFYNRETQQPIVGATEVMQVGPLVMARNPEYGVTGDFLFQQPFDTPLDEDAILQIAEDFGTNLLETEINKTGVSIVKTVDRFGTPKKIRKTFKAGSTAQEVLDFLGVQPQSLEQAGTLIGEQAVSPSEIKGAPDGEVDDVRWRSLKPKKTKAGKFIGTPEWVQNTGGLTRLRKLLRSFTEEGLPGRFWYEDSALEALRITNGDYVQAEKLIGLLAIYSPQTGVFPNTGFAIKAYTQWKNGDPVEVKTGDQNAKAQAWLDHGKDWGGRKVNSFYLNLMKELLTTADAATIAKLDIPSDVVSEIDRATVDLWVLRAMGYELDSAGGSEGLAGKYSFSENEIRRLAGMLNNELQPGERRWLPHQVQAALWTAIKARYEVPTVKKATIAESVKKGFSDYDPETGKWRAPSQNTAKRVAHMKIWRKHALAAVDEDVQKSVETAKGSFGTMLNRIAQNITWEAVPSTSLGLDITSADTEIRRQFTEEAISLLVDDTGHDQLADQLGVPLNLAELGTGGYAGDINTNAITTLIPIKPSGVFDNQTALDYARVIQYIFKQDAVPIFRAESKTDFTKDYSVKNSKGKSVRSFPTQAQAEAEIVARRKKLEASTKKDGTLKAGIQEKLDDLATWTIGGGKLARGVRISFKAPLDQAAEEAFFQILIKHLGEDAGYSKINGEVVVINFRDDETGLPFVNDEEFAAGIEAMEKTDGETLNISKLEEFGSEGQYGPVHDWSADPEGKSLELAIDTGGRPDLQSWVRDRREAFEALVERYSGEELAARQEEFRLHQQDAPQGPRGSFTPSDKITDQDGNPVNLIQIFEKGDRSTFLHESGHFWLEQLKSDATQFGQEFTKDWDTVTKWWGQNTDTIRAEALDRARKKKDTAAVEAISKMTDAAVKKFVSSGNLRGEGAEFYLSVAMHEQFARGTENYFKTGNAPSIALADAFVAFAVWIRSVYRSIQRLTGRDGFDVQFSPEVTAVMDRMIATDTEIEIAASQYQLASLFDTAEEAGMSKADFAAHQEQLQQDKEKAKIKHLAKRVKEEERERLDWWKEERETMRQEVAHDIARLPVYRLLYSITEGGLADGSTTEAINRMDRAVLQEVTEREDMPSLSALPKVGGKTIFQTASKKRPDETSSPGMVANLFGYEDVEQMVTDLAAQPDYATAVELEMDARMRRKHGSIDDGAVDVAIASIHEEDSIAKSMAAELAALRTSEKAINPKFVKAYAQNLINQEKMGTADPRIYLAAEKRHAKAAGRALKKGDRKEAYKHQFQRLTNYYLAAEATKQKAVTNKQLAYMRKFKSKRKKFPNIEAEFVDQIKAKVGIHDFGARVSQKRRAQIEQDAFIAFLASKEEEGTAVFDIPDWLKQKDRLVHFRDLTIGEFRDLHDTIKQLEKQGINAKKVRVGEADMDRDVVVASMITALSGKDVAAAVSEEAKEAGGVAGAAQVVSFFDAALLKIEFLLEGIDGVPLGIWHQALYQPFADAEVAKQDLTAEVATMIRQKMDALPKRVRKNMGKRVDVGKIAGTSNNRGGIWTRGNLIMLALNVGNNSNLDKVIRGERSIGREIDEELIDIALKQLTAEEWDFVTSIWEHSEKLWPTVEKIYRDEYGRSPDRVEPREVHTDHGTFEGGYFPLLYNTKRSTKGKNIENMNTLEAFSSNSVRATVNSSMTKERVQEFTAPIDFDIQKMVSAFDRTIHFMTHYAAVKNANRILGNPALKEQMMVKLGPAYVDSLTNWVGSIASNGLDAPATGFVDVMTSWMARNTTVAVLGASYSTLLAQILGYTTAIDRLMADNETYGTSLPQIAKDLGIAWGQVFSKEHREAIYKMSGEMRHRLDNVDRDLRSGMRFVKGKSGVRARVAEYSMLTIAAMQLYTVDIPVWTAAYNQSLRNEGDIDIAVKYADRVVRMSQSAGGLKDLAAVQRGKGAAKMLTMFYSFFSVMYAILRSIGSETVLKIKNPTAIPRMLSRLTIVLVLNELGYGLLRGEVPDLEPEDEDEDGALKWMAKKTISGAAGTVPFGRDIVEGMIGDYGYDLSPTSMFGEALEKSFTTAADRLDFWFNSDTEEEPPELKDIKPMVLALSIVLKLPGIQANRTLSGLFALIEGEDEADFFDLLVGYEEPEE